MNMAAVTMSAELKPKGIAVGLVHPGKECARLGSTTATTLAKYPQNIHLNCKLCWYE